MPTPVTVTLPPNPTPEQKREALQDVLRESGLPAERVEGILELLDIDDTGRVYITDEGMERLRGLLDELDIPEGAEGSPLALFRAVLDEQGGAVLSASHPRTAIVFFAIPGSFVGKSSERLHAVKMLSSESAEPFRRVYSFEDLLDGCSAVVETETFPGGERLKSVLQADDPICTNSRLALAIGDGGLFDLDGAVNGAVVDPAFIVEAERRSAPTPEPEVTTDAGGGCAATGSFLPLPLLLLAPLILLAAGRRR